MITVARYSTIVTPYLSVLGISITFNGEWIVIPLTIFVSTMFSRNLLLYWNSLAPYEACLKYSISINVFSLKFFAFFWIFLRFSVGRLNIEKRIIDSTSSCISENESSLTSFSVSTTCYGRRLYPLPVMSLTKFSMRGITLSLLRDRHLSIFFNVEYTVWMALWSGEELV